MRAAVDENLVPRGLRTEHLLVGSGGVTISVAPEAGSALCPACGEPSERVHSRYVRAFSNLSWHGVPVVFHARVRRFFCAVSSCERRIFCERLPDMALSFSW